MNQRQFINNYIEKTVPHYNTELFTRSDDKIIDCLENVILSCQREGHAIIRVKKFTIIEDYEEVQKYLRDYQDYLLAKASNRAKGPQDNRYQYIDLRDSDVKLLIVTYYIEAKGESDTLDVLIAVPRVVDKFYFRLNGAKYSAMYQIVDASTYNTSSANSNRHFITLKCQFQPIRIFRNFTTLKTTKDEEVQCCTYDNNTFSKSIPVMLYMFAKFGYYGALKFMGCYGAVYLSDSDPENPNLYTFKAKKNSTVFINCPKVLFERNQVVQHIVYVLLIASKTVPDFRAMFTDLFWQMALGIAFNNQTDPRTKGLNILNSLEFVYDIQTKSEIHLPEEYKHDTYCILRWMLWEYNNLRVKNNVNILTKKINCSEYIAAIYAAKLSRSIYRLSDNGRDVDLSKIRKTIITNPMYLITEMGRDQLINFCGMVTDMDSFLATKFTYKGESGIKTISNKYKLIHPSNLGILDPDASSPSDPGTSGSIVPMVHLHDGNYFSDFREPITWEKDYENSYGKYLESAGLTQVLDVQGKINADKEYYNQQMIKEAESIQRAYQALKNGEEVEYGGMPLEGSGRIQYI